MRHLKPIPLKYLRNKHYTRSLGPITLIRCVFRHLPRGGWGDSHIQSRVKLYLFFFRSGGCKGGGWNGGEGEKGGGG